MLWFVATSLSLSLLPSHASTGRHAVFSGAAALGAAPALPARAGAPKMLGADDDEAARFVPPQQLARGAALTALLAAQPALAVVDEGPPDYDGILVGVALFLVTCCGLLQLSLGDIAADEAMLPSSANLINKSKKRRSNFIKTGGPPGGSPF